MLGDDETRSYEGGGGEKRFSSFEKSKGYRKLSADLNLNMFFFFF